MNQLDLLSNIVSEYLTRSGESMLDPSDQIMEWHEATLELISSRPRKLSQEDGRGLVRLVQLYPTDNMLER